MSAASAEDGSEASQGSQSPRTAQRNEFRSSDVDLAPWLGFVRVACKETGWIPEKLAVHMECHKSYPPRVLNGEKPLTLPFVLRLPDEALDLFADLLAKSRGFIVAKPVSSDLAVQHLVSGLMGLLAQRVEQPKSRMAHADLRPRAEAKAV